MLRLMMCVFSLGLVLLGTVIPDAWARHRLRHHRRVAAEKVETGADEAVSTKPVLLGTFGEWGAYRTQNGKTRVCYAFAKPKERQPTGGSRDPSYVLVSTRPSDRVRNEVSVIMGFAMKDGTIEEGADVNGRKFDLIAKGQNAWVKSSADEIKMVDIMRAGSVLRIRAPNIRGKVATDLYGLEGVSQALERIAKECR